MLNFGNLYSDEIKIKYKKDPMIEINAYLKLLSILDSKDFISELILSLVTFLGNNCIHCYKSRVYFKVIWSKKCCEMRCFLEGGTY